MCSQSNLLLYFTLIRAAANRTDASEDNDEGRSQCAQNGLDTSVVLLHHCQIAFDMDSINWVEVSFHITVYRNMFGASPFSELELTLLHSFYAALAAMLLLHSHLVL